MSLSENYHSLGNKYCSKRFKYRYIEWLIFCNANSSTLSLQPLQHAYQKCPDSLGLQCQRCKGAGSTSHNLSVLDLFLFIRQELWMVCSGLAWWSRGMGRSTQSRWSRLTRTTPSGTTLPPWFSRYALTILLLFCIYLSEYSEWDYSKSRPSSWSELAICEAHCGKTW